MTKFMHITYFFLNLNHTQVHGWVVHDHHVCSPKIDFNGGYPLQEKMILMEVI